MSMVAGSAGAVAASTTQGGHVGVSDDRVDVASGLTSLPLVDGATIDAHEPVPDGAPTEASAWDVSTSENADTLSVSIGSHPDTGGLVMTLSDDENHAGREVSVDADALVDGVGRKPTIVYGTHENGSRWTSSIRYEDGAAVFDVPHFSTNTVTFEGEISLQGNAATDGAKYTYDVTDVDAVENFTIDVTGSTVEEWDNETATLANGDTFSHSVAGNLDPTGPSANDEPVVEFVGTTAYNQNNDTGTADAQQSGSISGGTGSGAPKGPDGTGDPVVEVTGQKITNTNIQQGSEGDQTLEIAGEGGAGTVQTEILHTNPPDRINEITLHINANQNDADRSVDIKIRDGGIDGSFTGTTVKTGWNTGSTGEVTIDLDQSFQPSGDKVTIVFNTTSHGGALDAIYASNGSARSDGTTRYRRDEGGSLEETVDEFIDLSLSSEPRNLTVKGDDGSQTNIGALSDGETASSSIDLSGSATSLTFDDSGGRFDWSLKKTDPYVTESPSVDIDGDGTAEASVSGSLSDGETATRELPGLSTSTSSSDVSTVNGSDVTLNYQFKERVETVDPAVEVNGNTTSHSGSLADGSTTSLSTDGAWVRGGTNRINISVGDGTLSADAPTPQVGFDYSHAAVDNVSVDYSGETWSERYNVSRTYGSDQTGASLTIPFSSHRVVSVRGVEHRVDGGSWSSVPDSDVTFDGSELTVDLGDVTAGETHEVRANGSKVVVENGTIAVTEPTVEGNTLDTAFEVTSGSADLRISVGGTDGGARVHHLTDQSWSGSPYSVHTSSGAQTVHLAPPDGATARIRTMPLEVNPASGSAEVVVEDAQQPTFKIRGASSEVGIVYYDTTSGTTYALKDVDQDRIVTKDTAESPVEFLAPDDTTLYTIVVDDGTLGDGGNYGGGAAVAAQSSLSTTILFVGFIATIVLALFLARRFLGLRGLRAMLGVAVGAGVAATVAIDLLTAGSIIASTIDAFGYVFGQATDGFLDSGAGAVAMTVAAFLALYAIDSRFGFPRWLWVVVGLPLGVFALDTITGGSLGDGLSEVSPLLWLLLVGGGIVILWRIFQPPTITVGGEN